jgi:alginate O-acetyltransferase complex protein AlgI
MLFNSFEFAVFFPIVTLLYFVLPHRGRVPLLLAASCWFYMAFVPKYILILAVVIIVDYTAGILIEDAPAHRKKPWLVVSLCTNVGILAFFKYFNFIDGNISTLADVLGWNYGEHALKIILPIGLSFHTFQSMSYTIEVYNGRFKAERSVLHFATYVMFYPQLVAGPIERPQNLLHQFHDEHHFDWPRVLDGLRLMAIGLFKKIIIADRCALLVNAVYTAPDTFGGAQLFIATCFFAIQIYCDFSGYSEIARGTARVMGFELMVNFDRPYLATSISDFWRRWHISLSTWFRDYVYFPLGGNRRGLARTCFNAAVVFLVSGLWHGANWTFVIWGALHATFIVVYLWSASLRQRLWGGITGVGRAAVTVASWFVTMVLVALAWVFFRAANVHDAFAVLSRIATDFTIRPGTELHPGLDSVQFAIALALIAGLMISEYVSRRTNITAALQAQPRVRRWTAYYACAIVYILLLLWSPEKNAQPFIYFQF